MEDVSDMKKGEFKLLLPFPVLEGVFRQWLDLLWCSSSELPAGHSLPSVPAATARKSPPDSNSHLIISTHEI